MWIVRQDLISIVNLDNILMLSVDDTLIKVKRKGGEYIELGSYENAYRAQEVFRNMMKELFTPKPPAPLSTGNETDPKVFWMPEK